MNKTVAIATGICFILISYLGRADKTNTNVEDHVDRVVRICAVCHGEGGHSQVPQTPSLAGQSALYTAQQLKLFRGQTRLEASPQAYMWGVSALLDDDTITGLADYYESQTPSPGKIEKPRLIEKGKSIYLSGIPSKNLAACSSCHGENGEGVAVFPRLAGQHAAYLFAQLQIFRTRLRPYSAVMIGITKNMTRDEMEAVAYYLQSK
jgi:cytochrome c553